MDIKYHAFLKRHAKEDGIEDSKFHYFQKALKETREAEVARKLKHEEFIKKHDPARKNWQKTINEGLKKTFFYKICKENTDAEK